MSEELVRIEASMDDWKQLYEAAGVIYGLSPWKGFKDTDILALGPAYEEAAYVSVMGASGAAYGFNIYEGVGGLNDFFLLRIAEEFGLTAETAMYSQTCLTCYFGDAEELSHEQKRRISALGLNYDKGCWPVFVSYAEGYYPAEPDRDEVIRLAGILEKLAKALYAYESRGISVAFDEGLMFVFDEDTGVCDGRPWPVPGYVARELIAPDELVEEANSMELTDNVLEIEMEFAGAKIQDDSYLRSVNPRLILAADAKTGEIIFNKVAGPGENYGYIIAEFITEYILQNGRPKRVKITNGLVESVLKDICGRCSIDLRTVRILPKLDAFTRQMISALKNMDENKKLK